MNAIGLDIEPHRKRMHESQSPLDEKFKDTGDPLRLVFVCAMWLTGFDAPSCSTIYLDKLMRNHTLMQTISRANRVFPGKQSGVTVDYAGEGPSDLWRWQRWKESGQRQAPTSSLRLIWKKEKAPAKLRNLLKALIRMDGLSGSLNFVILNRCSIRLEWQASVSDT